MTPLQVRRPSAVALSLVLSMLGVSSAQVYNSRADSMVRDLLGDLPLAVQETPQCTAFFRWFNEISFPNAVTNKQLVHSVSYVSSLSAADLKRSLDQHASSADLRFYNWSPETTTGFMNVYKNDYQLSRYIVAVNVYSNAADGQQALCYGIMKDQNVP